MAYKMDRREERANEISGMPSLLQIAGPLGVDRQR